MCSWFHCSCSLSSACWWQTSLYFPSIPKPPLLLILGCQCTPCFSTKFRKRVVCPRFLGYILAAGIVTNPLTTIPALQILAVYFRLSYWTVYRTVRFIGVLGYPHPCESWRRDSDNLSASSRQQLSRIRRHVGRLRGTVFMCDQLSPLFSWVLWTRQNFRSSPVFPYVMDSVIKITDTYFLGL